MRNAAATDLTMITRDRIISKGPIIKPRLDKARDLIMKIAMTTMVNSITMTTIANTITKHMRILLDRRTQRGLLRLKRLAIDTGRRLGRTSRMETLLARKKPPQRDPSLLRKILCKRCPPADTEESSCRSPHRMSNSYRHRTRRPHLGPQWMRAAILRLSLSLSPKKT
jgi:hypothetical protein